MVRRNIYIVNNAARRSSLKKRKSSLLKKIEEITILCDVQACAVIYSSNRNQEKPETFPSDLSEVLSFISDFHHTPDERNKMVDQETYLNERISKYCHQLKKLQDENNKSNSIKLMHQFLTDKNKSFCDLSMQGLTDLDDVVDSRIKEITNLIVVTEASAPPLSLSLVTNGVDSSQRGVMTDPEEHSPFEVISNNVVNEGDININHERFGDNYNCFTCNGSSSVVETYDQWFIDMMNKSSDAGVGSSKMSFPGSKTI